MRKRTQIGLEKKTITGIQAIQFGILACVALATVCLSSASEAPVRLDVTAKAFPELRIRGHQASYYPNGQPAAFRGFADPCMRRDPSKDVLWLTYSWPHMQHMGGGKMDFTVGVETHLASSHDGGKTWTHEKALWPHTPARYVHAKTRLARDGFVSHEVPNIVPCIIDDKPMWVGVRLDYFLGRQGNFKDREDRSFCLKLFAAPTVAELSDAKPFTFGHAMSSPECRVDLNVCDTSRDFPPIFIPNEPALYFKDGRLYLAFVVMTFWGKTPVFDKSLIAVFSTEPKGDAGMWSWRYHGKLASNKEAMELGGEALTQIELAESRDGRLLAFLTPEAWNEKRFRGSGSGDAFHGIDHFGCAVIEVASLDKPRLARRADGTLAQRAWLFTSAKDVADPGAAGYEPTSATGILWTLRNVHHPGRLIWSLHATGLHPPPIEETHRLHSGEQDGGVRDAVRTACEKSGPHNVEKGKVH